MSDYIEKSKALDYLKNLPATLDSETVQRCIETISNMPTVEAIPIEWIWKYWDDGDKPKNYALHIRDMIEEYKAEGEEEWE